MWRIMNESKFLIQRNYNWNVREQFQFNLFQSSPSSQKVIGGTILHIGMERRFINHPLFFKFPLIIPENLVEVNHQIGRSQWQLLALPAGCPRLCLFQHLSAYIWNNYSLIRIKLIFFISQINELLVTIWGFVRIKRGWKQCCQDC